MGFSLEQQLFSHHSAQEFEALALQIFDFQYHHNSVYQEYCKYLKKDVKNVRQLNDIPFLPIEFFKNKRVSSSLDAPEITFSSSGTTGQTTSKHHIINLNLYQESFTKGFEYFYGNPKDYCILALLPNYLERQGSSLIYMVDELMRLSEHSSNGYFLYNHQELFETLIELEEQEQPTLLIGVSFALLDFVEHYSINLNNTIVMETGGMKGKRKEITREELHQLLNKGFNTTAIHSEYGMTELLSQAYSKGEGIFNTPPWMKVLTRDTEDPLSLQTNNKTGGINVIDFANLYSCSFIATQDLGRKFNDGSFEILGRFDYADVRGCNLMSV